MPNEKLPGRFGSVKFPVTASSLLTIVLLISAWIYASYPEWHSTMDFLGVGFMMIATVLSAYYIGQSLNITIQQRDEALRDERVERAFVYVDNWDDPSLSKTKQTIRDLMEASEKSKNAAETIKQILEEKQDIASSVWDILNFFEGFSLAINEQIADEETLRRCFKDMVIEVFLRLQPIINEKRAEKRRPHLYEELESVAKRWNN